MNEATPIGMNMPRSLESRGEVRLTANANTEEKTLRDVSDGYITVHWPKIAMLQMPRAKIRKRELIGWAGMIGLTLLFLVLAFRDDRQRPVA